MFRRTLSVVGLATVLTLLCLALGGTGCNNDCSKEPPVVKEWKCKRVVGTKRDATQVWHCWDPATGNCWYVSNAGLLVRTKCIQHPFAE